MALSLEICTAERDGTTGLYILLKHFILAEAFFSKEIITVSLTYLYKEIANNQASWAGSEFPLLGFVFTMEVTSFSEHRSTENFTT